MAVVCHISSIKASPLALLKYVTGESKDEPAKYITGLNCSEEPDSAYLEMALCYNKYSGEKFNKEPNGNGKQKIKMHHYVMSFKKGEITAEKAHEIGLEWARKVFGNEHQILVATHVDTDHIHVHFAVNAYDLKGDHWIDNKKTLKQCRDISDKIMESYHLSVIENPKFKHNHKYTEWLARQNGTSWKEKLCDDIDRIILMKNVKTIADLIEELVKCGYAVRQGKYLSIKPKYLENRKPVRTLNLGDGYGLEELEYRINNKDREMSFDKILSYEGIQREYALCLRCLQIRFNRKNSIIKKTTYGELRRTSDLLCFMSENNIQSKDDFENVVNKVAEESDKVIKRYKGVQKNIADYKIVFDIGGTLMEYKGMPLSWLDYYKTAFVFVRSELDLDITNDDIDKSFEVMKSYNPRINPREYDVSPEVIFSEATAHLQGEFSIADVIDRFYVSMNLTAYIYPETIGFLDRLKAKGYKIAALTVDRC